MFIRRLALPAVIAASGLMALGAVSGQATTALRTDPGGALLNISTTIRNTTATPAVMATNLGTVTCTQTTVTSRATTNTSATSITGTGTGTITSCSDTIPVISIQSCRGAGAMPTVAVTSNATGGHVTSTDALVRCAVAGSANACYYTSATATGVANNAASTITYNNVSAVYPASNPADGLGGGICGATGTFSVKLTHGVVQSNQTLTITTS